MSRYMSTELTSASDSSALDLPRVVLKNGERGILVSRSRGWCSVELEGTNQLIKARANDLITILSPQMTTSQVVAQETNGRNRKRSVDEGTKSINTKEMIPSQMIPTLEAPSLHCSKKDWLLFSDIHVKASTVETCEEILDYIHMKAVEYDAGIVFLGDFWHVRGVLNVELLNRVLKCLRRWKQPVIMIPGNHDQVTLGGTVHSLEPLKYAFATEQIMMIDSPAICMDALWIPYRKDHQLLVKILEEAGQRKDYSIIFCHADVRGAWMNDGLQSKDGLDVHYFPQRTPIYSGHFHKPHKISHPTVDIRYVGSPYQTSLSERGQEKYLHLLRINQKQEEADSGRLDSPPSTKQWSELNRWPITFGRRYFKINSLNESLVDGFRGGDRVVLSIEPEQYDSIEDTATQLRDRGVEVEIRIEKRSVTPINSSEVMAGAAVESIDTFQSRETARDHRDPRQLFIEYMDSMQIDAVTDASFTTANEGNTMLFASNKENDNETLIDKQMIISTGLAMVESLVGSKQTANSDVDIHAFKDLVLEEVSLRNFGSYGGNEVTYPLKSRGLVLIRGRSVDNSGAESNGSGKTTLVMSIIWGLTGSMDTRLITDGRSPDVTFDGEVSTDQIVKSNAIKSVRRVAEVRVKGMINKKPFEVIRKRSTKGSELSLILDGKDCTTLSIKDTQALIDDILGIQDGLLQRCFFFGQHSHSLQSLLGLQDVRLKEELSKLVNVKIWSAAEDNVKMNIKKLKPSLLEHKLLLKVKTQERSGIEMNLEKARKGRKDIVRQLEEAERSYHANKTTGRTAPSNLEVLGKNLNEAEEAKNAFVFERIEPLRRSIANITNVMLMELPKHDGNIQIVKTELAHMAASEKNHYKSLQDLKRKYVGLLNQIGHHEQNLTMWKKEMNDKKLIQSAAAPPPISSETMKAREEIISQIAAIDASLQLTYQQYRRLRPILFPQLARKELFYRLEEAQEEEPNDSLSINTEKSAVDDSNASTPDSLVSCPTCGQDLPEENYGHVAQHYETLQEEMSNLIEQRLEINNRRYRYDQLLSYSQRMETTTMQQRMLQTQLKEIEVEIQKVEQALAEIKKGIMTTNQRLKQLEDERQIVYNQLVEQRDEYNEQLQIAEIESERMDYEIIKQRQRIQQYHEHQQSRQEQELQYQIKLTSLQTQLQGAKQIEQDTLTLLNHINQQLNQLQSNIRNEWKDLYIQEKLQYIFGRQGIQQYIFLSALNHLETITNAMLQIFTNGHLQLNLCTNEDSEKIIKSIQVYSYKENDMDGTHGSTYRERPLSLLSGGQWRRVSLSLDFAFSQLIRDRGILNCNLLVLDEILTHMDGSGREAVGTLLRSFLDGQIDGETNHWMNNRYETIIMILQDLVATELEESFDHIDTVVKIGDVSTVAIDGEELGVV